MRQERVEQLYMEIDSDNWNIGFFILTNQKPKLTNKTETNKKVNRTLNKKSAM